MPVYDEQVKRLGIEHEYTPHQVKEIKKCVDDLFHFLSYVKIIHPDRGRVVFDPYGFQKEMFDILLNNRFCAFLVARQMGKSLSVGAYALWYGIFNSDKVIGIVSNKETSAIDFLSRIKVMYEELPSWLKCGVVEYNKKSIQFENGTVITVGGTSKSAFRGKTANIIISDELAFVESGTAEDFFMSNYPTISVSSEGKFIAISTPNGIGGLFYELYMGAVNNTNDFVHYEADWSKHPDRDDKWADTQLRNIGQRRFSQEYSVDFLGSANTLIDKDTLVKLTAQPQIDPVEITGNGRMRIYEKPIDGALYVFGTDPSKGTGEHDACIQVMKIESISPIRMVQVAVFQDNKTDTYEFANILHNLTSYYTNSYIMCENNGEGSAVISTLHWDLENECLVNEGSKASKLGVRATTKTKPIAVLLMKKLIEDECIKLVDPGTINQLLTFIEKGNNKFTGGGSPDDLVSALYWAPYIFKMNVLEEAVSFKKEDDEDEQWMGIFTDNDDDIPDGYELLQR